MNQPTQSTTTAQRNSSPPLAPNDAEPIQQSEVTQWEVEQKFHLRDPASLRDRLTELGFEPLGVEQHQDTYWQHPARDFRQSDEAFRIRRVNHTACITYKGPRAIASNVPPAAASAAELGLPTAATVPAKTREEIELNIDAEQYPQWLRMLAQLGFQPQPRVVKERVLYSSPSVEWEGLLIAVDAVEQLGDFVEVEQLVRSKEQLSTARARIDTLAERLGLREVQPRSYLSLLLDSHKP